MIMTSLQTQALQPQAFTQKAKPMHSTQRLEKVAQEYEALFAKMLIQSMYKSVNTSQSLFSNTSTSGTPQKMFDDMLYEQYADAISKQKILGISTLITEHYKSIT